MQHGSGPRITAGLLVAFSAAWVFALACGDSNDRAAPAPGNTATPSKPPAPSQPAQPPPEEVELSPEELAKQGRGAFMSNCIACHNQNPSQAGAVGPAIAGSSLELIEAKVMRNQYPEGYTPKRTSSAMVAMPFLEKKIPALHAFLAAAK